MSTRQNEGLEERIYLQPIAGPSILGFFGFAGATFVVSTHLAGWYGSPATPQFLFPFVAIFGGIAQFLAGMWSYRARDALGTAMHGTWGSFFMAYGLLYALVALGVFTVPATGFIELGYWFIALAAITWVGALASVAENGAFFVVLGTLAAGATLIAIGEVGGFPVITGLGGWALIISAIAAWYTASALLFEELLQRRVLPLFETRAKREVAPGRGEPGVMRGQ